jgi:hypothetical protein
MNKAREASPGEHSGKTILPENKRYVTNAMFPYQLGVDSLLYLKTSFRHRPAFYIKDASGEHLLRVRDISVDEQFSYRNGNLVYAAYEKDPRWDWRDYSVIKLYNIYSGEHRTVTKKSKYFTPDISASGRKIAAVEFSTNGISELHLLDATTGGLMQRISLPDVGLFSDPKFIGEDSLITAVRFKDGKMALALVELITGKSLVLTPPTFNVVGYPSVWDNTVFFTASYGGADNVFALRLADLKIFQVTQGSPGQYFVNAGNNRIVYSLFTAEGYQLVEDVISPDRWHAVGEVLTRELKVHFPVSGAALEREILAATPGRHFNVSNYRKTTRLLNFHSWRPYYEDPEFSFSLYGQNILNTLETEVYYLYNQNDNTSAAGVNAVYGGIFPRLNLGTQYTFNRVQTINNKTREWDQLDTRVGFSIPLSTNTGRSFRSFSIGSNYGYRSDMIRGAAKLDFRNINFSYLSHSARYSQQVQAAVQHIFPRLGFSVSGQYNHAISQNKSWQYLGGLSLYLPGIASTHNLVLTGAWQETDTSNALFGNRFSYSRGFIEGYFSRMWRGSANYHFPLIYPDWGFGNILYLHRIRANGFFDFTRVFSNDKTAWADQRSAGGEIFIDTKWWNQYELSFGFRVCRLLDEDLFTGNRANVFEFILPVSILPR